jgi:hypothetical protein
MIEYLDFSSLLVLAIGCNLIYIVNRDNNDNKLSFFLFLKRINNTEEAIKKLSEDDKYKAVISSKLKECRQKTIQEIENEYGKKDSDFILKNRNIELSSKLENYKKIMCFFTNVDKLQYIALITFIYSFFVALLVPYKFGFFNEVLLIINIVILLFSIALLIYDITVKIKSIMRKIIFLIITSICLIIVWFLGSSFKYDNILHCNYAITILVCFTGFILYTILHIIGYIVSLFFTNFIISPIFSKLKRILLKDTKNISI